jgi:AcrR family transcriptional regulator
MNYRDDIRYRILKVAESHFLKFGYKNLRIDGITKELGISKRTFYEIFGSKNELIHEIVDLAYEDFKFRISEIINRMSKGDDFLFIDELRNLWQIIVEHTSYFTRSVIDDLKLHLPGYWEKCERYDADRIGDFKKIYNAGIKNGYIKPNIREDIFYVMHFHALKNLLNSDIRSELPLTVNEILSNFYEILLTGALTENARAEYKLKIENDN